MPTATSEGYDVFWESYTVLSAPVGISDEVLTTLEDALQKASEAAVEDPDFATQTGRTAAMYSGFEDSEWATAKWTELDEKWQAATSPRTGPGLTRQLRHQPKDIPHGRSRQNTHSRRAVPATWRSARAPSDAGFRSSKWRGSHPRIRPACAWAHASPGRPSP